MINSCVEINERIKEAAIYIFNKNPETGLFTYSRPLSVEEAECVAEAANASIRKEYKDAEGLRKGLSVDGKKGVLYNMNTFKGILANRELMKQSNNALRFSTISEGFLLHDAKMLPSGELMDFGLAVYSIGKLNKKLSESLVAKAQSKNYALPLLASFVSLGLQDGGEEYGVTSTLVSDADLITGTDAVNLLERFANVGNSGVQRLGRYDGGWCADWDNLGSFYAGCRVGRVSGKASAKNLRTLIQAQIEQNFSEKRKKLEVKLQEISMSEKKCIDSAESTLSR